MSTLRTASVLVGLLFVVACGASPGNRPVAAASAGPRATQTATSPSPVASPTAAGSPVFVAFDEHNNATGQPTITLSLMGGSVVATVNGRTVGDEHAIGAYLVIAADGSGNESVVDANGTVKPVAAAAARLLAASYPGPLVLDSSTAIIGCIQSTDGSCTADEINLTTGAVRQLLTAPGSGNVMQIGPSLTALDASTDLQTVWFREATATSLDIAAVNLQTGAVTRHALPGALLYGQDLAISRDGQWVAGHEDAGVDSNNVLTGHLHLIALATGNDADIQGTAPYVSGGRPPSIQFAPGGDTVAWWGEFNSGGLGTGVNVAPLGGVGKTVLSSYNSPGDETDGLFWNDSTTLVAQDSLGNVVTIDTATGTATPVMLTGGYLLGVIR